MVMACERKTMVDDMSNTLHNSAVQIIEGIIILSKISQWQNKLYVTLAPGHKISINLAFLSVTRHSPTDA